MNEDKRASSSNEQNIILKNRNKLLVSGVRDVDSFNEECIVIMTELGMLIIRGENLHINKLNIEQAELDVEGEIISCEYADTGSSKGSLFSRFFR